MGIRESVGHLIEQVVSHSLKSKHPDCQCRYGVYSASYKGNYGTLIHSGQKENMEKSEGSSVKALKDVPQDHRHLTSTKHDTSQFPNIVYLPPEILLKVFSYFLPHELCRFIAPVCRDWHSFAYDCSLWHRLDMSKVRVNVTGLDVCKIVLFVSGNIQELSLHGLEELSTAEMTEITKNCPLLTHLDLSFIGTVHKQLIHAALTHCPKLQYLNVEGCRNVNNDCAREIALYSGKNLCRLNFSHCPLVDDGVITLAMHLAHIVMLNIDGISWISDRAVEHLVAFHRGSLEDLELDGAELTDQAIVAVAECQKLTSLSVSFSELLSDFTLRRLESLSTLRRLCLRKGLEFTSHGLTTFLSAPTMSSLQHLDLSECHNLRDDGVQALTKCCGASLKTLTLSWCWEVTDVGLTAIMDRCCSLGKLYLVGLHRLTGFCLDRIPEEMLRLTHLDLQQCNLITDQTIEDIVWRKPDLVVMNYYGEIFMHSKDK